MTNTTAFLNLIGCSLLAMPRMIVDDAPVGKIVNGTEAKDGEFPFLVGLQRKLDHSHRCGGTIITKNWVLTAAHCCVLGPPRCWSLYFDSVHRDGNGKRRFAKKFIVHEDYDNNNYINDICLVRVFPPFKLRNSRRQVTLPPQDYPVPGGVSSIAAGWGFTTPDVTKRKIPNTMMKVNMVTIDREECERETEIQQVPGYLCARGAKSGQGILQGDSGGPLLKGDLQIGISSWVLAVYDPDKPNVFVRVPRYINWIKNNLGKEAYELKFLN